MLFDNYIFNNCLRCEHLDTENMTGMDANCKKQNGEKIFNYQALKCKKKNYFKEVSNGK